MLVFRKGGFGQLRSYIPADLDAEVTFCESAKWYKEGTCAAVTIRAEHEVGRLVLITNTVVVYSSIVASPQIANQRALAYDTQMPRPPKESQACTI